MRYVKLFEQFENIHKICKKHNIRNYNVNPDGSIDVDGDVYLGNRDLNKLPLRFNKVSGSFSCNYNQLTTLEGSPKEVGGHFLCFNNKLTTLEGGPKEVGGGFNCEYNQLTTLEGAPKIIRRAFSCNNNNLFKFEGSPDYVKGGFRCYDNPIEIIWELFQDFEKVELLNDYDLLRVENGKGVLIWNRLVDFLEIVRKSQPTEEQIEKIKEFYEIR